MELPRTDTHINPEAPAAPLRTFIACPLPESVTEELAGVQNCLRNLRMPLRWVKPGNIHLTLKFLGDLPRGLLPAVERAMAAAAETQAPFTLRGAGLGCFPNPQRVRVVWVGLAGDTPSLANLQQTLAEELADLDPDRFPRSKRSFRGHLTLGRVKGRLPLRKILEALKQCGGFDSEPFRVERLVMYQSDLRPTGAVYTHLAAAPLGGS